MTEKKWCPFSTNEHGERQYSCNEKCGLYDEANQCCSLAMVQWKLEDVEQSLDALRKQLKESGGLSKLMEE